MTKKHFKEEINRTKLFIDALEFLYLNDQNELRELGHYKNKEKSIDDLFVAMHQRLEFLESFLKNKKIIEIN